MSQTMDKLKIGDKLAFRGPRGRFHLDLNEKRALGEAFQLSLVISVGFRVLYPDATLYMQLPPGLYDLGIEFVTP